MAHGTESFLYFGIVEAHGKGKSDVRSLYYLLLKEPSAQMQCINIINMDK